VRSQILLFQEEEMKKLVVLVMLLAFAGATLAIAAGKDVVVLENKKGTITFEHKKHQDRLGGDCTKCHEGTPAKFEVDKNFGHKTCKACHKATSGPTKCNGCHVK
jgi:hypothetical protein